MDGLTLIAAERARQITEEGYDDVHDAGHEDGLVMAAASYAMADPDRRNNNARPGLPPFIWPWDATAWKPTPDDRIRELVKAGALIAAAIDSLLSDPSRG